MPNDADQPDMKTDLLDFDLPAELIAQIPAARRDESRLLVVDRKAQSIQHCRFNQIGEFLPAPSLLIRNNASVLPARLRGTLPTGGSVEFLLLRPVDNACAFTCLARPARKLGKGVSVSLKGGGRVVVDTVGEGGERVIRLVEPHETTLITYAKTHGEMPLPPYIERKNNSGSLASDQERYQTVYADPGKLVAAAAPTAGLHFTLDLLESLAKRRIQPVDLTLHVGLGTFQPVQTEDVEQHRMHSEFYEIPSTTTELIQMPESCRVAVGTTSLRSLEDFARRSTGKFRGNWAAETSIYIVPPATFQMTNALITNFHLPRSTLLCLVAAFLTPGSTEGVEWMHAIYREAIKQRYRFFSYGDAMLIL